MVCFVENTVCLAVSSLCACFYLASDGGKNIIYFFPHIISCIIALAPPCLIVCGYFKCCLPSEEHQYSPICGIFEHLNGFWMFSGERLIKRILVDGDFEIKSKIDSYRTKLISDLLSNSKLQNKTLKAWTLTLVEVLLRVFMQKCVSISHPVYFIAPLSSLLPQPPFNRCCRWPLIVMNRHRP